MARKKVSPQNSGGEPILGTLPPFYMEPDVRETLVWSIFLLQGPFPCVLEDSKTLLLLKGPPVRFCVDL